MKSIICLFCLCLFAGCNNSFLPPTDPQKLSVWVSENRENIIMIVRPAAQLGTEKGLKEWSKRNNQGAREASIALSNNIEEQLLPYFRDDQNLVTKEEVKQLLSSSLFKNVPDVVKTAVVAASAVLDFYLRVPGSGTYLNEDQKEIIVAFLEGIQDGCNDFNSIGDRGIKKNKIIKPTESWIE